MGKLIIDGIEVGGSSSASSVKYNNTNSTLVSTNVQGAITELNESLSELNKNITALGESVSNGKTLVANAITAKGVSTSTSAEFSTMATNISNITSGKVLAVAFGHTNGNANIMLGNTPVQKLYDSKYLSFSSSTGLYTAKKAFKASIIHTLICCGTSSSYVGYSQVKINSSMASGSSKLSSKEYSKTYQVINVDIAKGATIGCFNEQSNSYAVVASMAIVAV